MEGIKWKVCGLRDNIVDVLTLQPDYVGFIFYKKSPRYVGDNFEMPDFGDSKIKRVGVFVNEPWEFVYDISQKYMLDYVQLHGGESSEYCEGLKQKQLKIIKAFQIDETFEFKLLKEFDSVTDFFLFDTKTKSYGGSGESFDWKILKNYTLEKKYFLSGGLSLDNIEEVNNLDLHKIHALDVNSKFELTPGHKNIELLERLKENIERFSIEN